jgi:anti-sigma B factor antagonist
MPLAIEQREREGILILALAGHLTIGPEDVEFRNFLDLCIATNKINIVLDCRRLGNIDSVGLGTLVYYQIKLQRAGGKFVFLNLAGTHMELLVRAKLDAVFEVFDDEQEAVNSFFPDRVAKHFDILEFVEELNRKAQTGNENLGARPA